MAAGELIKLRHKGAPGLGPAYTYQVDDALAVTMPDLALPPMTNAARSAFRTIVALEAPYSNDVLGDCLALAEARGFSTDPRDWVPEWKTPGRHLPLYQPWVDWLTDHGHTKIHGGNSLTAATLPRFTPAAIQAAFAALTRRDRSAAADLVFHHSAAMSTGQRLGILGTLTASGSFDGSYPWQAPLIRHFLDDRNPKVRDVARLMIDKMHGLETEEAHALMLARHLMVEHGRVRYAVRPEPHSSPFWTHWASTSFEALAAALGQTVERLAHGAELDLLDSQFEQLATRCEDVEVRTILVRRLLTTRGGEGIAERMFRGLDSGLRERGLQAYFQSAYWNSVQDYLGSERGYLTPAQMHAMSAFAALEPSVVNDIKHRKRPINKQYDPLRAVALSVGKAAAQEALDRALAAGMKPDNPRLAMLRFNLAL